MEAEKEKSEFTLINIYSWRSFFLATGMSVTLLLLSGVTIFIDSDFKYVAAILLGVNSTIIFLLRLKELKRTSKIIVNNKIIVYESEKLIPNEIDEIIISNWIIDIKRKQGIRSHIRVALKDHNELEILKNRMIEYGKYNNVKVRNEL